MNVFKKTRLSCRAQGCKKSKVFASFADIPESWICEDCQNRRLRHLAAIDVHIGVLSDMLRPQKVMAEIDSPLPKDASFSHAFMDPSSSVLTIVYEHSSFDPVLPGNKIPKLRVVLIKSLGVDD